MSAINTQIIEHAKRIEQFLNDDVVQTAMEVIGKKAYEEFLNATTEDARRMAQAKGIVAREFQDALHGVVQAGEHEAILAERKARDEMATRAPHIQES